MKTENPNDRLADIASKRERVSGLYDALERSIRMRDLLRDHGIVPEGSVRVGPCSVRRGFGRNQDSIISIRCNGVEIPLNEAIPWSVWEERYGPIRQKN